MSISIGSILSFESENYQGHYFRHRCGEIWKDKYQNTDLYKKDASWKVRTALNGRSDAISLESVNYQGHYLRHVNGLCRKDAFEDTKLFRDDASWVVRKGLFGKGVSFQSTNYATHYIRHQGGRLKKHKYDPADLYRRDATWIIRDALYSAEEEKFQSEGVIEFQALVQEVTGYLAVLSHDDAFFNIFGFQLKDYLKQRRQYIRLLRLCSEHIRKVVHDTGVARTAGGAVGVASGAMILGGLLAAPFTAGASLSLTAGGAVAGLGSAATTITASFIKDLNINASIKDLQQLLATMKERDDKIQKFMEELGARVQKMRDLQEQYPAVLEWLKYLTNDIGRKIGYSIIYKGYKVYESVKAARFAITMGEFIQADYYTMWGITVSLAAPEISIFGRSLIVASTSTAKLVSGLSGIGAIGFGIYDIVEGEKDMKGSETADELEDAAMMIESITMHYEELISKLKKAAA